LLSEILYNEPESRTRLEWIEIYNSSDTAINLSSLLIIVNDDTLTIPEGSYIPSASFAVLSRQLISDNGSDSFERHWGDSSGFWGDYVFEDYSAFDLDFSLPNSAGTIIIIDSLNNIADSFSWHEAGDDGRSIERNTISPPSADWHLCLAPNGSTPGRPNSPSGASELSQFNVTVSPRIISLSGGDVFSVAYAISAETSMKIEVFDDSGNRLMSLLNDTNLLSGQTTWNGCESDGHSINPGIYLLLFSLDGQYSTTKTIPVVIAP